jgi:hypothetical protein
MEKIRIFIETGKRKTFAGAIDWPGWCRWGRDEDGALESLKNSGERYGQVLLAGGIEPPANLDKVSFQVVERHEGNRTTDFGAHDIILDSDQDPVDQKNLPFWAKLLEGSWTVLDQAVENAQGKELRKGPRGGGRDLEKIMQHVLEGDHAYLRRLAWKVKKWDGDDLTGEIIKTREIILQALEAAVTQGLPEKGPRGGKIWPARFYIRRVIWHILDHAWEIEERILE